MTIKQFIEKAIEGGWEKENEPQLDINNDGCWVDFENPDDTRVLHQSDIFLDPKSWQAVGKVEGWEIGVNFPILDMYRDPQDEWQFKMHQMIDALAEGKTIEEFLKTL